MSFLVELGKGAYGKQRMDRLTAASAFSMDNARAMMWMSQLAYETAHEDKVSDILDGWGMRKLAVSNNELGKRFPPLSACFVAAERAGATIITFAGSDPLEPEDWITDFMALPSPTDLHSGFERALGTVWPKLQQLVSRPNAQNGKTLFFTGHSLGGALAILAAQRAMRELDAQATAVYTFGSPRTGGDLFFNAYTPALGDSTFRLVHGSDIVPTVPPALPGDFRHVGRAIVTKSDGVFEENPALQMRTANDPNLIASALQAAGADFRAFTSLRFVRRIGPRTLDRLAGLLPRIVRDHVPANYFRALSIPLT
jgi:hypothetical protein